jgi:hypothetical protein
LPQDRDGGSDQLRQPASRDDFVVDDDAHARLVTALAVLDERQCATEVCRTHGVVTAHAVHPARPAMPSL